VSPVEASLPSFFGGVLKRPPPGRDLRPDVCQPHRCLTPSGCQLLHPSRSDPRRKPCAHSPLRQPKEPRKFPPIHACTIDGSQQIRPSVKRWHRASPGPFVNINPLQPVKRSPEQRGQNCGFHHSASRVCAASPPATTIAVKDPEPAAILLTFDIVIEPVISKSQNNRTPVHCGMLPSSAADCHEIPPALPPFHHLRRCLWMSLSDARLRWPPWTVVGRRGRRWPSLNPRLQDYSVDLLSHHRKYFPRPLEPTRPTPLSNCNSLRMVRSLGGFGIALESSARVHSAPPLRTNRIRRCRSVRS